MNGGLQLSSESRGNRHTKERERKATGLHPVLTRHEGQMRRAGAHIVMEVPGRIMMSFPSQETNPRKHRSEARGAIASLSLTEYLREVEGRWLVDTQGEA